MDIPAARLDDLARRPGLTITRDAPIQATSIPGPFLSNQIWPYQTGNARIWTADGARSGPAPTIAIVDSGIDASRADFAGRVLRQVTLTFAAGSPPARRPATPGRPPSRSSSRSTSSTTREWR